MPQPGNTGGGLPDLKVEVGKLIWGVHHDTKHENILVFESCGEHIFKIADFGTSSFYTLEDQGNQKQRDWAGGTAAYAAPNVHIQGQIRSPYDLWLSGCVFLELMI